MHEMLQVNFDPFPVLTSDRLVLRQLQTHDVHATFSLRSNPDVMRFVNRPLTRTIEEAMEWHNKIQSALVNNEGITWGIAFKEDMGNKVGNIGLWRMEKENYRAEIGYMLDPMFQGKHITTEAVNMVVDYGFRKLNLHTIEAKVDPENIASMAVLRKTGFVLEGTLKENYFRNGSFRDTAIFSIISPFPHSL
jgi:ribosomal-protein-alanine N-acetyltransferase